MVRIKEFFRANYYYWYNRLIKIIPINFAYIYMKIGMIFMVIFAIGIFFSFPNYKYYESQIVGRVEQIEQKPKNWNIRIDSQWYFVQRPAIRNIEVGNRVVKLPDSWVFTVYDSLGNIKYQDSLQTVHFDVIKKNDYAD